MKFLSTHSLPEGFARRWSSLIAVAAALAAPLAPSVVSAQQTFFPMSSAGYSQNFADIDNWTANYAAGIGANNWRTATSVVTSTVTNVTVFSTGTSGGVQKGTQSIVFLATGTNSGATDLLLNFNGQNAGTMTFDYEKIVNSANATPRTSDLKIQYSVDNGATFTDLTGYTIPRITNNSTAETGSLNITLPSALNNQPQSVIRFFFWNNGQTGGAGNRPKWSIDNLSVTSAPNGSDTTAPTFTTLAPLDGATNVPINTTLSITFNEAVLKGTSGNITVNPSAGGGAVATIPVTDPAVVMNGSGTTATITLPASLSTDTGYFVNIAAGAFKDTSNNNFAGISTNTSWNFTTTGPDILGPVPTAFIPANGATNVTISPSELKITFNETISLIPSPSIEVRTVTGNNLAFTFDDSTAAISASTNELTITPFTPPTLAYSTQYFISVPAGTVEDALLNDNLVFGAPASSSPWVFTTAPAPIPPTVVVNKYANSGASNGIDDVVELLVIGNETVGSTLDMAGMILKDFSGSMANDGGGRYQFNAVAPWQNVPVGTLIVLRSGTTTSSDTNASDFKIEAGMDDTALFTKVTTNTFDIGTTDMVMIKASGTGDAGVTGGIHASAGGIPGAQFNAFLGPKLIATGTTGTNFAMFANNSNSLRTDYDGTDATGNVPTANVTFGAANSPGNAVYISQLRGTNPANGDGVVVLANTTPSAQFSGTPVFPSGQTLQTVRLTVNATIPSVTLGKVDITVPTDFGVPGIVSLSGAGVGSATSSVAGQIISITGAAATTANPLVVSIAGLSTPTPGAGDYGSRTFAVSTTSSTGTLAPVLASPRAFVVIPITKLRDNDANGVSLALNQQVAVVGVCTEENFGTTNIQAVIQNGTVGVALFNGASATTPFVRGNSYAVYGPVGQFNGLTQVNYTGFVDLGTSVQPSPVVFTVPNLLANAETLESSLVTVQNLTIVSGTWAAGQNVIMQDSSANQITIRIQAGSSATTAPTSAVNVTGVFGQFDNTGSPFDSGYQLLPRDPADLTPVTPPGNTFANWISSFSVGGQTAFNDDFDKDALPNALENILGSNPSLSNTGISAVSSTSGNLVFRHTQNATPATDLVPSYEWSTDLVNWNASTATVAGTTVTFGTPVVISAGPPALVEVTATVTGTLPGKVFARLKVLKN